MRRKVSRLIGVGLLLFCLAAIPAYGFGGDVDYSSGGNSGESGSGDTSWTSGGSGSDSSDSSSSGGSPNSISDVLSSVLFIGIVGFIIAATIQKRNKTASGKSYPSKASDKKAPPVKQLDLESIQLLREEDRSFDPLEVEATVREWVFLFEKAWCAMDMTPCREYIDDELFDTYQRSLAKMEQRREISRTVDLTVEECVLERWYGQSGREYLSLWIEEKKRTFIVGAYDTTHIIKGNHHTRYQLFYR